MSNNYNIYLEINIKCLQINLQRSKAATAQLNKIIIERKYDIIFIQEPYVIKSKVCGFPIHFKLYYKQSNVIKTAIVVINHKIQTLFIESLSNHFLTIVKLHFKSKSFYGFSIYCSPFESLETELIDSNAKSKVWFNNKDNRRGHLIIDFINQNNLFILNDNNCPQLTTYYTTRGVSNIDLTITDLNSFQLIKNCKIVDTFDSMSDHKYIEFLIRDEFQKIKYKNTKKYIIKSDKWSQFSNHSKDLINFMKPIIENINDEIQFNCFINSFSDKLTNICDTIFIIKNYD